MSHLVGKPTMWFPNRSDTNRPVQLQKQARSLKFWSYIEEELYYSSSKNKGADQLRGYREADLRLCFRLCRLLVFPWGGSYVCQISRTNVTDKNFTLLCYKPLCLFFDLRLVYEILWVSSRDVSSNRATERM